MHMLFLEPFLTPILFVLIIVVLFCGVLVIWNMYRKDKEFEKKREDEFKDYEKVLTDAHTKAETIMGNAAKEASDLSREGDAFAKQVNQHVDDAFKQVVEKNLNEITSTSHEFLTSYQ